MLRLKDRQKSIPNGFKMYVAELKWSAPGNFPSFTKVCDALQQVIQANPFLAQKNKWPTDRHSIEDWVDTYNATLCAKMGWDAYVANGDPGGSIPKSQPPMLNLQSLAAAAANAKELVSGAKTLIEWIDSKEGAVERDLAQSRALTCSTCPKNEEGDLTRWFTVSASELIRRQIEKAQERSLSTIHDEKLNLCSACHCPLKLKVHVPIEWITKRLTPAQMAKLKEAPHCWILEETKQP